ncbi:MAG: iron ABC transporter permease [Chloroflexi bacterium]|nr:MAG: iron ABC transporter permease [Chloroflexota bacterium]
MGRSRVALKFNLGRGVLLAPLIFLTIFYFYPLVSILSVSLFPAGRIDLSGFSEIATSAYYHRIVWFTIRQAIISTVLTILLALPCAYLFARYRFPGRSILLALTTLPFVLPPVVVAIAFTSLIGRGGLLNRLLMSQLGLSSPPLQFEQTFAIIIIVHVFYNFSIALRMMTGFWMNQSRRIEEAARVMGAHGWRLWWTIYLPILRPVIAASGILVFIFTFTSFGVILILGGVRFATIEVEIYRQTTSIFNLPLAAALSLLQIAIMTAMMLAYTRLQRNLPLELQATRHTLQNLSTRRAYTLIILLVSLIAIMIFTPLLALVVRSFMSSTSGTFSLRFYKMLTVNTRSSILFVPPVDAIINSVKFAFITTLLASVLGMMAAYLLARRGVFFARWIDPLFMLPLATSAVTLGFGFIIALDEPPLNLRTSPMLIPIAHTLVALPFVVRSLLPALRRIPPNIPEAARMLGASPVSVWWLVELPLMLRSLVVGAVFAFTISMGEFGASLFIARPETPTLPVAIFRLFSRPGAESAGQALALSVILMGVSFVSFLVIERLRTPGTGEF